MADLGLSSRPVGERLLALPRRPPWWLSILALYAGSRVVSTGVLLHFASRQQANAWTTAQPEYLEFARLWDGTWYWIIAAGGYPDAIPRDEAGLATENAFAFMPVYPFVVRGVMVLTGLPFAPTAVAVSVLAGAVAALLFHRLVRTWLDEREALLATALLCLAPVSPILQVAYAEALHLALLLGALLLVVRRRYAPLAVIVTIMALTRPSGLAFAFGLALLLAWRWCRDHRALEPFPMRERIELAAVTVIAGLAGLAWPGLVALLTGDLTGYIDTELAWRRPYIGPVELVPFTAWWQGAQWWLGDAVGPVVLVVVLAAAAASFALPQMRRMPVALRCWIVAYAVYLLAVFFPQSSTFRLLLPLAPVLGAIGAGALAVRPRWLRAALVMLLLAASVAGQLGWVHIAWWVDGADWTPP
ncbi:hypothetical protein GCM10009792_07720 [Microcella alkalica]|uniref:Mannosyltransferase (PIG-V) n=1 Tax=Microcella alkalica TaxID=355930 RepID=A0A839E2C5_9MICO|nr:hypothetical protein [Microcella alkalica]MBA8846511.1 hypothetical protein [Microcella alkalica]